MNVLAITLAILFGIAGNEPTPEEAEQCQLVAAYMQQTVISDARYECHFISQEEYDKLTSRGSLTLNGGRPLLFTAEPFERITL